MLQHGQAISATDLELLVSDFGATRFAALCNALSWKEAGCACIALPSFTERVNVADGGIDGQWENELSDSVESKTPLIGPGWTVYQYKQRSITARDRKSIISGLRSQLKGALADVEKEKGKRPHRYVLFTNVDLMDDQKTEFRKAILDGMPRGSKVNVEIVGAAELAASLNNLPSLRLAFFTHGMFETWEEAVRRHKKERVTAEDVDLVGRETLLKTLQAHIADPNIRAVVVSGPTGMGKSLIALEATRNRPIAMLRAFGSAGFSETMLRHLETEREELVVIVEDVPLEELEQYVSCAIASNTLKILITLPTSEKVHPVQWGQKVQIVPVEPLSDDESRKLLEKAGATLDYSVSAWITDRANGNPGLLLMAAANADRLINRETGSFVESVAQLFEDRERRKVGDELIDILRLLSLLRVVNVEDPSKELTAICTVFGGARIDVNAVLNALDRLQRAGLIRMRGSYAEAIPMLFGNHLAHSAVRGRSTELWQLFSLLSQQGRSRLIQRMVEIPCTETETFWSACFAEGGLCEDLFAALSNPETMKQIAGAAPERVARLFLEGLDDMTIEERRNINGDQRRQMMWTLEELLFRRKTALNALRCLLFLGEAENENYGNNATKTFTGSFHCGQPQVALSPQERLSFLQAIVEEDNPQRLLLIIEAINDAFDRMGIGIVLRSGTGAIPLDGRPQVTYGEIWDYQASIADLLLELCEHEDEDVAEAAREHMPHVASELVIQAGGRRGIDRLKIIVEKTLSRELPLPISNLAGNLDFTKRVLIDEHGKLEKEEGKTLVSQIIKEVDALLASLEGQSFDIRLKRWTGKWHTEEYMPDEGEDAGAPSRGSKRIQGLAEEVLQDPSLLTPELLRWLCSKRAEQGRLFFDALGRIDTEKRWVETMQHIGRREDNSLNFACYCNGLSVIDGPFVSRWLDELVEKGGVRATGILQATVCLPEPEEDLARILKLLEEKKVEKEAVLKISKSSPFSYRLNDANLLRLLRATIGAEQEHVLTVLDVLAFWHWKQKERQPEKPLADFTWDCLDATVFLPASRNEEAHIDHLAALLVPADPERGFALLEKILTHIDKSKCWSPLEDYGRHEFWTALCEIDRPRAVGMALRLSLQHPSYRILPGLKRVVGFARDEKVLKDFAIEGEKQAALVCECLARGSKEFWTFGTQMLKKYPKSNYVLHALEDVISQSGRVFSGSFASHYERNRTFIREALASGQVPAELRQWLTEWDTHLTEQIERWENHEEDVWVNEFKEDDDNPDHPQRLWSVEQLLMKGKLQEALKVITKDHLLNVLHQLHLSDEQKQRIQKELEKI